MTKTAATAEARRILSHGWFSESATRSYAFVDRERVFAEHSPSASTAQRIAAVRAALVERLTQCSTPGCDCPAETRWGTCWECEDAAYHGDANGNW